MPSAVRGLSICLEVRLPDAGHSGIGSSVPRPAREYVMISGPHPRAHLSKAMIVSFIVLVSACRSEVTEVAGPGKEPPGDTTGTGGGVQRRTMTVRITIDEADAAIAQRLGMSSAALANADVVAQRSGSSDRATGRTDAQGVVQLPNLLPGFWSVSASAPITDAQRATLDADDRDVTAWSAAGNVDLTSTGGITLSAVAGRRGSLVISEWDPYAPPTGSYGAYPWGQYVEIYNNSDTTIYLDGKIFGKLVENSIVPGATWSCASTVGMRMNPTGIWTRTAARFPGSGRDNPLLPGAAVIIATDAVDHRPYNGTLPDLSGADYEFVVTAGDVDNPTSKNLLPITFINGWEGHGPDFWVSALLFVADNVPDAAIKDSTFEGGAAIKLIPQILDAVAQEYRSNFPGTPPMCRPLVASQFDRQTGRILNSELAQSMARPVVGQSALGKPILQRTKSSDRDFVVTSPSPRTVP